MGTSDVSAEIPRNDEVALEEAHRADKVIGNASLRALLTRRPALPSESSPNQSEEEELFEMHVVHNRRRRKYGGCGLKLYEPWALVQVTVQEQGKSSTQLRCANAYGAPIVSRNGWDEASQARGRWNSSGPATSIPCYVRSTSAIAARRLSTANCDDNDFGHYDSRGDSCSDYWGSLCGKYDNGDFDSRQMCCVCGGGTKVGGGASGSGGASASGGASGSGASDDSSVQSTARHDASYKDTMIGHADMCAVAMDNPDVLPAEEVGVKASGWLYAEIETGLFICFICFICLGVLAAAREKNPEGEYEAMQAG